MLLDGVVVPEAQRVGTEGGAWSLIQRTLAITHGCIPACSSGISTHALRLACIHASERRLYGGPIIALGAIHRHVLTMAALDLITAALSLKAMALVNRFGVGSSYYCAVAKHACSRLAELAVDEGRLIHGARAFLRDHPYSTLVADALLPGTFDGTTHVVLEQVSARLLAITISAQAGRPLAPPEAISDGYRHPPQAFADALAMPGAPIVADPAKYADWIGTSAAWCDLAPVAATIRCLLDTVLAHQKSGRWQRDQAFRLAAAGALSWAEAMLSLADLADPGVRARHCLPPLPSVDDDFRGLVDAAMGHCGLILAGKVQTLQLLSGSKADAAIEASLVHFAGTFNRGAAHFDAHPGALIGMVGSWI